MPAYNDLDETIRFAGDCSQPWKDDGVFWGTSEFGTGERGVQSMDLVSGKASVIRDMAGGLATFAQATDTAQPAQIPAAGNELAYLEFFTALPTKHMNLSPVDAFNTDAAHSMACVAVSTQTTLNGLIGRYTNNTDARNVMGRPGTAPLDTWQYARGQSSIRSPISATGKFAAVSAFNPAEGGANGTIKLMVNGKTETPVAVVGGTGAPTIAFKIGALSATGSFGFNGRLYDFWIYPFDFFENTVRGRRHRRAWRTFVEAIHGIDCFPKT